LLQFLDEAGVTPTLSDERCLSFAERIEAERAATISALQTQNHDLVSKLETADRLSRISIVVLIGGTLALFVAVCVLGAVLLSRRRTTAPDYVTAPQPKAEGAPAPFEGKKRFGLVAIVGAAAVAAIVIVGAGVAFMRGQGHPVEQQVAAPASFSGAISCTLDRNASAGAQGVSDMNFSASGALCINERTLYAPIDNGSRFRRAIVLGEARALDVLTIDPHSGEFRRERYPLTEESFGAANEAVAASSAGRGCSGDGAAVERRNQTLMRFAQGSPSQRLIWRCAARQ
jgi:hypothetical protein